MNEFFLYIALSGIIFLILGWFIGKLLSNNKLITETSVFQNQIKVPENEKSSLLNKVQEVKIQLKSETEKREFLLVAVAQRKFD